MFSIFFGQTCPTVLEELTDVGINHLTSDVGIPCACLLSICKPCLQRLHEPGPVLPKYVPVSRKRAPADVVSLAIFVRQYYKMDKDVEDMVSAAQFALESLGDALWEVVEEVELDSLAMGFVAPLLASNHEVSSADRLRLFLRQLTPFVGLLPSYPRSLRYRCKGQVPLQA